VTSKIKLSVVTVTYNDPSGLKKTLSSLTPLNFPNAELLEWEVIVIDSSPEISTEIVNGFLHLLPIKHIVMPKNGIYPAFNLGIHESRGELIWFLNGGDTLYSKENLHEILNRFFGDNELALVYAATRLERNGVYLYSKIPSEKFISNILGSNGLCQQAIVYRKSLFSNVGLFSTEMKIASDYKHHFECFIKKVKEKGLQVPLVNFDVGGSSSHYIQAFKEFKEVHRSLRCLLPWRIVIYNEILRSIIFLKIRVLKILLRFRFGEALRLMFYASQRNRK
jgi:glycosyltransferase involved in cell wall biosynthesis